MDGSFLRRPFLLSVTFLLGLSSCAAELPAHDDDQPSLPQQAPVALAAPPATTTDIACKGDGECATLSSSCAQSTCDIGAARCVIKPLVPEGTACGETNLCDHIGRCLPCGAQATSTFELVQGTIFDSTRHGCQGQVCHGSSPGQGRLDLRPGKSYDQMLNVKALLNPDMLRIKPGEAGQSYVLRKVLWASTGQIVAGGGPMPAGGAPAVPGKLITGLAQWINAGAKPTGFQANSVAQFCDAPCVRNSECVNTNLCDGAETCQAGKCVPGAPLACDDGLACTADHCDPLKGCKARVAPGLPCGEGGVCDDAGACQTCDAPGAVAKTDASADQCVLPEVVTGKLEQAWDFSLPKAITSQPLVLDGTVYATSWTSSVYALDQKTGAVKWELPTESRTLHAGVTAAPDGTLLFGDGDAMVWRIDRDGNVLWKSDQQETGADHIWSNVSVHDGIVYVPLASHTDVPCTKGRTVALSLADGKPVWARYNVPRGGVCRTDTSVECSADADCPGGGKCESAVGGSVSAGFTFDPDGKSMYVNTVGCYTFPQVGDTNAMMKLDAKTGAVKWLRRFSENEQFNYCRGSSKECRTASDCSGGEACVPKTNYYDFGFINAPLLIDAQDGKGGKRKLLVSGEKSGQLIALHADSGEVAWINRVLPIPRSPGFASYGLFNGKLGYADGKIFAALYELSPTPPPAPDHLTAFSEVDGKIAWADDIGRSWSSLTVHDGVVYAGTQTAPELYAYNTRSGARLATYKLPFNTAAPGLVADDMLFIGYGVYFGGGLRAFHIK
ncbi:MAG: PQQ-binding-like beta-propeller repeat protein [Polyangiales bacterium]